MHSTLLLLVLLLYTVHINCMVYSILLERYTAYTTSFAYSAHMLYEIDALYIIYETIFAIYMY
jgi:hypothetical protein